MLNQSTFTRSNHLSFNSNLPFPPQSNRKKNVRFKKILGLVVSLMVMQQASADIEPYAPQAQALANDSNAVCPAQAFARDEFAQDYDYQETLSLVAQEEVFSPAQQAVVEFFDGPAFDEIREDFEELIKNGEKIDLAYFIGCTFMMMNCSNSTRPHNIRTFVALNPIMVDGTGMCGCCRVSVNGDTKFACVDGPEFDGHLIDWEELFQRKEVYVPEEVLAYQYYTCKGVENCE